ncbi:MAG: hypothetical protein WBV69_10545 [Candidatus Sulfotelmatobacter sp.]
MKLLAMLIFLLAVDAITVAQFESGTVIVVGYSQNKIIIAADSRSVDEGKVPTDNDCKITALSNKLFFSASGRTHDVTLGMLGWDATDQARQALAAVSTHAPIGTFTQAMAIEWAQLIGQNISHNIRQQEYDSLIPRHVYIAGIFAGLGPNVDLQGTHIRVDRGESSRPIERHMIYTTPVELPLSDTMGYLSLSGQTEILNEFIGTGSARAKIERAITLKESKRWPIFDSDARMVIRLTELVIKYWNHPELAHGPVDAVEIDKGGSVRWIQRKPNCTDQ